MKLEIPDDIYKAKGMTPQTRNAIQKAVNGLMNEYVIKLDNISAGSFGEEDSGTIFAAGPFKKKDGTLGYALAINTDIDYNRLYKKMGVKYRQGYFAGETLEDYIAHEMAHIMTFQDCKTELQYKAKKKYVDSLFKEGASGYADATRGGDEMIAEGFVRMRKGDSLPPEIKTIVRVYIERWKK